MKSSLLSIFLYFACVCTAQKTVVTEDIPNFWRAYDLLLQSQDSTEQLHILEREFIAKGTEGLKGIMQARRYTAHEYLLAIKRHPDFWKSVRGATLKADYYAEAIEKGIASLRDIYPELKPATVYFTIGALRTGGTTLQDRVLIGCELAMADSTTPTASLLKEMPHLPPYFASNPIRNLVFLNVHEFIHTQQKTSSGESLLAQTVIEGVAEFVACKALGKASPNPQIAFGQSNASRVKEAFQKELFSTYLYHWIWNNPDNAFNMRDLAYYVGYAICEAYYTKAADKEQAIRHMIELDYTKPEALFAFVDASGYFDQPLAELERAQQNLRPYVTLVEPFDKTTKNVSTKTKRVVIHFSQAMDKTSGDFLPALIGREQTLWIQKHLGFSEDSKSYTIEVQPLQKNKRYQLQVTDAFLNSAGYPLKPYLIDISTAP